MGLEHDIERIGLQEQRLQFQQFDANTAWHLGARLRQWALGRDLAIGIDIRVNGHLLFHHAMPGATPDNADWIRRKCNLVQRYQCSSYLMKLRLEQKQTTLEERGMSTADFAAAGGCFPILLRGTGCVGTVTVSGLPQREDHALVVEALAEMLDQPLAGLALAD